nr:MAG TPA: hypothetical protein [Caudoviricetes sp.]
MLSLSSFSSVKLVESDYSLSLTFYFCCFSLSFCCYLSSAGLIPKASSRFLSFSVEPFWELSIAASSSDVSSTDLS